MTEEIISKKELKNLRFLLQSGQKLAISTKEFERVFDKIDRLEQENRELKADLKQYDVWLREERQDNAELATDNFKLRSALEEIREIVKQVNKDICDNCGWHNTDGCMPNGYLCHNLIEIKNKINEVLNPSL